MADRLSHVACWVAFLVAGMTGLPAGRAEPQGYGPLTMVSIPGWVRSQTKPGRVLRLALVGCSPDAGDSRLRTDERFQLRVRGGKHMPPLEVDTELVVWLRRAAPRLALDCAPLKPASGEPEMALAEAIEWAMRGHASNTNDRPEVLYISSEHLQPGSTIQSNAFIQAIGSCWKAGCLPITVAAPERVPAPCGFLVVSVMPQVQGTGDIVKPDDEDDLNKLAGLPISLYLSSSSLEGAPSGLGETRAAAAFLMIASVALRAEGTLSHLERAARLGQATPIIRVKGKAERMYRLVDVRAAADPAPGLKISFINRAFPWPTRVIDLEPGEAINTLVPGAPTEEISRRILTSVHGEARIRHLNAVAHLAGLQPVYLTRVPRRLGLAFYQLDSKLDAAARGLIINLLHTQEGCTDDALFNAVGGDEPLTEPRPTK